MRTVKYPGERRERLGYFYRSDTETEYVMDVSHHSVISQHEALFSAMCKSIASSNQAPTTKDCLLQLPNYRTGRA